MADPATHAAAAPAAAPVRPRRWRGRLLRATVVLALTVVLIWIFAPAITICILRRWLPLDFDGGQLGAISTAPLAAPAAVTCQLSPRDARRILCGASGYWLPPWYLRSGQSAAGILQLDDEDARTRLPWLLQVAPTDNPLLVITLSSDQLEELTAPLRVLKLGPMTATWSVRELSMDEGVVGQAQIWKVIASGTMHLRFNGWESEVQIRQLLASLTLIEHPLATGWRPEVAVAISRIDVAGEQTALLSSPQSRHQLEQVISARVNTALRKVVVPAWFPPRFLLQAEVRPTPSARPPAAAAPQAQP